jgi:hypothetical protein
MDDWEVWAPTWAPLVYGRYTKRVFDSATGQPEEQQVEMMCRHCGAVWQAKCLTGRVRDHINRFAVSHVHKDKF